MLFLGPRIAEIDVDPVGTVIFVPRKLHALDILNGNTDIVRSLVQFRVSRFKLSFGENKHFILDVHCHEIYISVRRSCLRDKAALAAAEFNVKRSFGVLKKLAPMTYLLLRFVNIERTSFKLGLCPWFMTYSHVIPTSSTDF